MIKHFASCFLLLILFQSCDCHIVVEGRVLSNSSQIPIDGAIVELVGKNETTKTDKNGYFKVEKLVGFCFDPTVRITKGNYKPFEITFRSSDDSKAYEIKSKSDFVKYDKPFYPDSNNRQTLVTGTQIDIYSKNFSIESDGNLFYLDTINLKQELKDAQTEFRTGLEQQK